jgi:hypothetical protein
MLRETIDNLEQSGDARPFAADSRESALIERLQSSESEWARVLSPA